MKARRAVIPVFVPHLGCPHTCVFCNQRRISGALRPVSAADVEAALLEGLPRAGEGAELAFYGGSFTAIPASEQEELLGAALPFLHSGELASIRLSTRPDAIDAAVLERLRRFGVGTVELGVQSMCPEVLALSERGHTPEDAERAAKMVKDAGFRLILQMMTGLPGDTRERSVETALRLAALRPDGVRIYPTVIIRDTALFDMWRRGEYKEHTVEDAVSLCAELLDIFDAAGIPVIRLGLNPTDDLSAGDAAGGAYHPALGELARSRRYLKKMSALLTGEDMGKSAVFAVSRGRTSLAVGQRRANALALEKKFGVRSVKVVERDIPEGETVRLQ